MYHGMFVVGLVMTILFLTVSIILYFRKNVSKLLRDLTGKNVRGMVRRVKGSVAKGDLSIRPNKQETDLTKYGEENLSEEGMITLRLCGEKETCLLMKELEKPLPEIFEVLEDITEFYGK